MRLPEVARLVATALTLVLGAARAETQGSSSATEQPVHGLKGHYYGVSHGAPGPVVLDEYELPVARGEPTALRVDRQVEFGRGKGFVGGLAAWTPQSVAQAYPGVGVIWKGYLRLPKAGEYYVTTVSVSSSAVYLNQSRIALNGGFGGSIYTEAFTHVDPSGAHPHGVRVNAPTWAYVVPVTVKGPRVVPIEVRYWNFGTGAVAPGIDLYWVTPDSPRDTKTGKPIPEIVPAEALYIDPPEPIAKATTHAASSTISSEYLDLPIDGETYSTITVRLADKDGRPVAGHRVHVSSAAPRGDGWGAIVQPEAPTDSNGIATARFRHARGYPHDAQLFATDVTDLVDVAQVAHLRTGATPGLFFPLTFGPYYDSVNFVLEPKPQVGRPTTITVPLTNRQDAPHELRVRVSIRGYNIGMTNWKQVGETEKFVLKPKENRLARVVWTPTEADTHICYKVDILGRRLKPQGGAGGGMADLREILTLRPAQAQEPSEQARQFESRQQNLGTVAPPSCGPPEWVQGGGKAGAGVTIPVHLSPCARSKAEKYYCEAMLSRVRERIPDRYRVLTTFLKNEDEDDQSRIVVLQIQELEALPAPLERCVADPPDAAYQRLATAASDTPSGYLDALTTSVERYQGAEAAGDREWMTRHLTARRLYLGRHAEALRRAADAMQKRAEGLPPDDPSASSTVRAEQDRFFERWRRGERFSQDQRKRFKKMGISEERAMAAIDTLAASKESPAAKSLRTSLLETATLYRNSADEAEGIASAGVSTGVEGKKGEPVSHTFLVGNPRDKAEAVDLFIRPMAMPPGWKLSVVDSPEPLKEPAPKSKEQPTKRVQEVVPGKHYRVSLPAKGEIQVASMAVPVGEVGMNTTARWAVEGKIGDEMIGGMVHEMHAPGILPDLQLPPIGATVETATPQGAVARSWWSRSTVYLVVVGASLLVAGTILIVLWRRSRKAD